MILEIITSILAISGVVLNNRKSIYCFPIWIMSNFIVALIHAQSHLEILMLRDIIFLVLAIHGWHEWQKKKWL